MAEKYAIVFGFDKFTDWKLLAITAKIEDMELSRLSLPDGIDLVDPESVEWIKILEYNLKYAGGINRDAYIKAWMSSPAAHTKVRSCNTLYELGPSRSDITPPTSVWPASLAQNPARVLPWIQDVPGLLLS